MAYVTPNSTIKLCSGVPFDKDYDVTSYFASRSAQTTAIHGKTLYTFSPQTYQRVGLGAVRVNRKADDLYTVNYMAFQNTAYGSKWFYAFVDSVDYINDSVSQVNYSIDVLQTYLLDGTIQPCYVERAHTATDDIGDNILPEPVELGEYVGNGNPGALNAYTSLAIVVLYVDVTQGASNGTMLDGVYTGCTAKAFHVSSIGSSGGLDEFIADFIQTPDAIVAMYMCPSDLIGPSWSDGHVITSSSGSGGMGTVLSLSAITTTDTLNGYTPKNNKMYTYPYNYLTVSNANGEGLTLRYEFFNSNTPRFLIDGTIAPPVTLKLLPCGYKGSTYQSLDPGRYIGESIELNNYPMCSWNADYFKAWLSQNAVPTALSLAGGVAATAAAKGDISKTYGISQAVNVLSAAYTASIHADIIKGNISSGCINVSAGLQKFWYNRMSVAYDYAKMIDDFFTRYGYAQNRIMNPPVHVRSKFTYVKTKGCKINGSMPAEAEKKIEDIFDRGVTFWNGISGVGDFSGTNNILT